MEVPRYSSDRNNYDSVLQQYRGWSTSFSDGVLFRNGGDQNLLIWTSRDDYRACSGNKEVKNRNKKCFNKLDVSDDYQKFCDKSKLK